MWGRKKKGKAQVSSLVGPRACFCEDLWVVCVGKEGRRTFGESIGVNQWIGKEADCVTFYRYVYKSPLFVNFIVALISSTHYNSCR